MTGEPWFYGDVVRHTPRADPASYRHVRAKVKQSLVEGWIALPGYPGPPGGVAGSPYRGLNAFGERDAALFFGRDRAAAQVLDRMSRSLAGGGLVVVSGVSGAGKSSLLRAGVVARIRDAGLAGAPQAVSWPCLVFAPGGAPLDDLALGVAPLAEVSAPAVRRELREPGP